LFQKTADGRAYFVTKPQLDQLLRVEPSPSRLLAGLRYLNQVVVEGRGQRLTQFEQLVTLTLNLNRYRLLDVLLSPQCS
jgi:hypothetical protein